MVESRSSSPKSSLAAGDHLGPYEIVSLLGEGGMGVVYRAHDSRLGRDVALKIMRHASANAEQIARFSREARAAGSLNHSNIVAVFDVGTEGGVPYVVSELLEGETLRDRLRHGLLPLRKALDYGVQIAQALDAAHRKGIWHRDVKPANVFVTGDGRVKLLDFGIAKLNEQDQAPIADVETDEASHSREIRGTPGYMSPEQVRGGTLDHRTDIFSLGAVLYEMFTGARAFQRPTSVETMNAVLQAEPEDPLRVKPDLSPTAAAVVRRCLEKNKEDRFQSARDLAFQLQQLNDGTGSTASRLPSPRPRKRLAAIAAAVVGVSAVAILLWQALSTPAPSFQQLTFSRGRIGAARFASGGAAVVYSLAAQGHSLEVSRIDLADSPTSRSLDFGPGTDILATRAGDLALLREPVFVEGERFVGTLAVAPLGRAPHETGKNVEYADWSSSGDLALVQSSGNSRGQSRIEYPSGHTLYATDNVISFLRVSPDGEHVAFVEDQHGRRIPGGVVSTVDRKGTVTPLTDDWDSLRGLAWSPSGGEIWFTAAKQDGNRALRAVTMERKQRLVLEVPGSLTLWDIASDGRVLLTRDEERRAVVAVAPGDSAERDVSWFDLSGVSAISSDGRWVLCGDRFGVYRRGTDGSPPVLVISGTNAWSDALSPDGQTVLATMDLGRKLVVFPPGVSAPQTLEAAGVVSYSGAYWFPGAGETRVLFAGQRAGEGLRSYVQDIKGGPPKAITPEGSWGVAISPDGKWIAGPGSGQAIPLWPVDGGEKRVVPGSLEGERPVSWSADGGSLWLYRRGEIPAKIYKLDIATGRREAWKTINPPDSAGVYSIIEFRMTPSGNAYAYSYSRLLSQLYLVRGLK